MKKYFFILLITSLVSCIGYYNDNGAIRPKKNWFSLAKKKHKNLGYNIVDTNSIYLSSIPGFKRSFWFRFFSHGKVIYSEREFVKPGTADYETEDTLALNDLQRGAIGYYEIIDTNILHLNIFYKTDLAGFYHIYGKIDQDKFILYDFDGLPKGTFTPLYLKTSPDTLSDFKQKKLDGVPDW